MFNLNLGSVTTILYQGPPQNKTEVSPRSFSPQYSAITESVKSFTTSVGTYATQMIATSPQIANLQEKTSATPTQLYITTASTNRNPEQITTIFSK